MIRFACGSGRALLVAALATIPVGAAVAQASRPPPSGAEPSANAHPGLIAFSAGTFEDHVLTQAVFVVASDGSGSRVIADGGSNPVWSPDGRRIAYIGDGIYIAKTDATRARRIADADSLDLRHSARWSPDGKRIVYDTNADPGIAIVNVASGARKPLAIPTLAGEENKEPDWSPDGQRLAFTRDRSAGGTAGSPLYVVNVDGRGLRQVTSPPVFPKGCTRGCDAATDRGVRWSPDGKSLLFYREGLDLRDESAYPWLQRVYTVSAQGGRPTLRFTAHVVSVGWSPDGKKIIYTGSQRDGPAGARIHIYDMARHSDRPLHLGLCAHTSCIDADWQRVGNR